MEQTECFETSEYNIQTPGNYPEESIQYSEKAYNIQNTPKFEIKNTSNIHLLLT